MFYRAPGEIAHCPSCGNRSVLLGFRAERRPLEPGKHVWFISGCNKCGLVFANPPPPQQEIDGHYVGDGDWASEKLEPLSWARSQTRPLKPGHAAIVNMLDCVTESNCPRRVLDFGCGRGQVLRGFRQRGWETYGVDPATGHLLGDYGHTMLDQMPAEPMFDAIVMNHVLEHVPDPLDVLCQAAACIRSQGHIYVGTPSLDRLQQHGKHAYCINRHFHISAFTVRSMSSLLARAGFRVVRVCEPELPQRLALLAQRSTTAPVAKRPLRDARRALRGHSVLPIRIAAGITNLHAAHWRATRKMIRHRAGKWRRRAMRSLRKGLARRVGRIRKFVRSATLGRSVRSWSRRFGRQ